MMQGSIPIRFICFVVATLSVLTSAVQANAGVRVAMADDLEPGRHFLVNVNINYRGIDGGNSRKLASCFLTRGEEKNITVLATIPFIYHRLIASSLHPAYLGDGARSDKMPFALRTVKLPILRPQSWRYILDNGGEVNAVKDIRPPTNQTHPVTSRGRVVRITPDKINSHFDSILWGYLPAFDRAGIQEDLNQYLPLLNDMAAFAHSKQAYENTMANTKQFLGEKYVAIAKKSIKQTQMELDQRLVEIKAWLRVEQGKRAHIHEWLARFFKADYVYREMMDDSDHNRIKEWLEEKHSGRVKERKLQWTNPKTGVAYTLVPENFLIVDLNPFFHIKNRRRYMAKCYPHFHRNEKGIWEFGRLK